MLTVALFCIGPSGRLLEEEDYSFLKVLLCLCCQVIQLRKYTGMVGCILTTGVNSLYVHFCI